MARVLRSVTCSADGEDGWDDGMVVVVVGLLGTSGEKRGVVGDRGWRADKILWNEELDRRR